jgi:hypothetical protein
VYYAVLIRGAEGCIDRNTVSKWTEWYTSKLKVPSLLSLLFAFEDIVTWMDRPMGIEVWVTFLSSGWADRATLRRPRGNPRSWPVCHNEFSSGHWPASGVDGHNCKCRVDDPLNLPRDRLWAVPCQGVPQTAGSRAVGILLRTLG